MTKNHNSYTQAWENIRAKIEESNRAKGRSSSAVSKSDLENLTVELLNSPDHIVTQFSFSAKDTSGTGEPVGVEKKPSKRYRESLKPTLRQLGLDKHDADKIDDVKFSKEQAAAILDVATTAVHDYIRAGRKFSFPVTEPDETRMEIYAVRAPERTSVGNRFQKDSTNNSVTITKERTILKSKNGVPYWLKSTEE